MKLRNLFYAVLLLLLPVGLYSFHVTRLTSDEHPTLAIGSPAPDFNLPGVDGKNYSLASFKNARLLLVVFTCNHCPTAQAYEERLKKIAGDYKVTFNTGNLSSAVYFYRLTAGYFSQTKKMLLLK